MDTSSHENYEKRHTENRRYNLHFYALHRQDGMNSRSFVHDDMRQIFYPQTPGVLTIKQTFIQLVFDAFTQVIPYDQQKYDDVMLQIMSNPQNTFLNTNHATFLNVPLAARELHRYARQLHHTEKIDHLFTILAPSLTTQSQRYIGNSLSHFLKTFTINPRSCIDGLKQEIQEVRNAFKEEVVFRASHQGNTFLLAPEGTRNAIARDPQTGEASTIYMEKNANVRATEAFLLPFIQNGDMLVLEGMNETATKRPDKTDPKNHTRTKGNTYVDIQDYSTEEAVDILQSHTLLEHISRLVRNKAGKQIGQVVNSDDMKDIKSMLSKQQLDTSTYSPQDFDDTLTKKIIRALFFAVR